MISDFVLSSLENIFISPLELCNLNCQYCYTKKTKNILANEQILDFVNRYQKVQPLKSIIFCGGEVFTLSDFTDLINHLISQNIFITIITNGTIDCLEKIKDPSNCQLIVSFDGPQQIHDYNRGHGNFIKSKQFVEHALSLNFPVDIFYLVTSQSFPFIDTFSLHNLPITYLTDRLGSLNHQQVLNVKNNYRTFPSKDFGCFQISLQSNGQVTGCCETKLSIGKINDPISKIINKFSKSLNICQKCQLCSGCCDPHYLCGYPQELSLSSCQNVIESLRETQ